MISYPPALFWFSNVAPNQGLYFANLVAKHKIKQFYLFAGKTAGSLFKRLGLIELFDYFYNARNGPPSSNI